MATIGSLVVNIGMNSASFTAGSRKIQKSTTDLNRRFARLERTARRAGRNIERAFNRAFSVRNIGLVAAGLAALTVRTINAADEQIKLARSIGLTYEQLQLLQQSLELSGINANSSTRIFRTLRKGIADLEQGTGALQTLLRDDQQLKLEILGEDDLERVLALIVRSGNEALIFAATGARSADLLRQHYKQTDEQLTGVNKRFIEQGTILTANEKIVERAADQLTILGNQLKVAFSQAIIDNIESISESIAIIAPALTKVIEVATNLVKRWKAVVAGLLVISAIRFRGFIYGLGSIVTAGIAARVALKGVSAATSTIATVARVSSMVVLSFFRMAIVVVSQFVLGLGLVAVAIYGIYKAFKYFTLTEQEREIISLENRAESLRKQIENVKNSTATTIRGMPIFQDISYLQKELDIVLEKLKALKGTSGTDVSKTTPVKIKINQFVVPDNTGSEFDYNEGGGKDDAFQSPYTRSPEFISGSDPIDQTKEVLPTTFGEDFFESMKEGLSELTESMKRPGIALGESISGALISAETGFANLAARGIIAGEGIKGAFQSVATSLVTDVLAGLIKVGGRILFNFALTKIGIIKTTALQIASSAKVEAVSLASAAKQWIANIPAAIAAAIGSFGAAAVIGIAAVVGALALAGSFAEGGLVTGPGSSTSDSINARLSRGEFVVRASEVPQNLDLLSAINRGNIPQINQLGPISGLSGNLEQDNPQIVQTSVSLEIHGENLGYALSESFVSREGQGIVPRDTSEA